ncbi:hypothetical protein GGF31_007018 [Allomyces arbusculus]|nr:hypothetical protein GGF31_007018 [Allomyces arbusculus]
MTTTQTAANKLLPFTCRTEGDDGEIAYFPLTRHKQRMCQLLNAVRDKLEDRNLIVDSPHRLGESPGHIEPNGDSYVDGMDWDDDGVDDGGPCGAYIFKEQKRHGFMYQGWQIYLLLPWRTEERTPFGFHSRRDAQRCGDHERVANMVLIPVSTKQIWRFDLGNPVEDLCDKFPKVPWYCEF